MEVNFTLHSLNNKVCSWGEFQINIWEGFFCVMKKNSWTSLRDYWGRNTWSQSTAIGPTWTLYPCWWCEDFLLVWRLKFSGLQKTMFPFILSVVWSPCWAKPFPVLICGDWSCKYYTLIMYPRRGLGAQPSRKTNCHFLLKNWHWKTPKNNWLWVLP